MNANLRWRRFACAGFALCGFVFVTGGALILGYPGPIAIITGVFYALLCMFVYCIMASGRGRG